MKEIICGFGLLCSVTATPADEKTMPFNRRVDLPVATVSWDVDPEIVKGLVRDYLISKGEVVKAGQKATLECGQFYSSEKRICRYVVWVEVPFDSNKP